MAQTVNLTLKDFEPAVKKDGLLLVDVWASWCAPCRMFGPVFERAAAKHPEAVFAKVDVDAEQELAGGLQIRSIPTLMVFRDGIMVFEQPGMLPEAVLEDLIRQVSALDMDDVRKQLDAEQAQAQAAG
jgi:thioredoxin 1